MGDVDGRPATQRRGPMLADGPLGDDELMTEDRPTEQHGLLAVLRNGEMPELT